MVASQCRPADWARKLLEHCAQLGLQAVTATSHMREQCESLEELEVRAAADGKDKAELVVVTPGQRPIPGYDWSLSEARSGDELGMCS
jgi:hypothetical protein